MKKNLIYQSLYQVLINLLPLITAPYISRILGVDNVGIYSYTYSIANYFFLFAMLGVNNYGNREIAISQDNQEELNDSFSNIFYTHLLFSLLAFIAYIMYAVVVVENNKYIYIIQAFYVISAIFDVNWLFWGIENFRITVIRNTIIKILTVLMIFAFVKTSTDLWKYTAIMAIGMTLSQSIVWFFIPRYVKFVKPDVNEIKKHMKPMIILFIPIVAVSLYKVMDKIMLGSIDTTTSVGFYESAEKIVNIPVGIITAIGSVMLPRLSNMFAKNRKTETQSIIKQSLVYIMVFAFGCMFGLLGVSDTFCVVFYGKPFQQTGTILGLLATTIPFLAFSNVLRTQYLIPKDKYNIFITSVALGALVNLCLNIILIPKYAAIGAAVGTIAAEIVVCVVQVIWIEKEMSTIRIFIKSLPFAACGCCLLLYLNSIDRIMSYSVINLLIMIISGVIVYLSLALITLVLMRDSFVLVLLKRILRTKRNNLR